MAMRLRVIDVAAAALSVIIMVLIVTSWDPAGFAIAVTTREIARIHFARFSVEVLSLALVTLALGEVVKALMSRPSPHPAWRQRWLWTAVLLAAASGGLLGVGVCGADGCNLHFDWGADRSGGRGRSQWR